MDSSDNIVDLKDSDLKDSDLKDSKQKPLEFFNVAQAFQLISAQYNRQFTSIDVAPPAQMVDGSVIEFIDQTMNVVLASARLRLHNVLLLNNETGDISIACRLSDLSFGKKTLPVSLSIK
jgi:hypothetical protein